MNHKDHFFATINYQQVDRPASWLELPVPAAEPSLLKYFGVNSIDQLRLARVFRNLSLAVIYFFGDMVLL